MKKSILASILSVASVVSIAFVANAQVTTSITCPPRALFNIQTGQRCPTVTLTTNSGSSTCLTLTRNLSIGSKDTAANKEVSQLQTFLKQQGLYTYPTITGYYGSVTAAAVRAFQKKYGIAQVGIVGPVTRAKIKTLSCVFVSSPQGTNNSTASSTLPAAVVVTGSGSSLAFTSVSSFTSTGGGGGNNSPGPTMYTVTANAGTGGSITPGGTISVQKNQDQTFTFTPSSGYQIQDVQVDGISQGAANSYTLSKVQADHTISVSFIPIPPPPVTYTITSSAGSGGTISPSGATQVTFSGTPISQTYTITPNSGFQISSVVVDGSSVGAVSTYTFTNISGNHTIAATFSSIPVPTYSVTASAGANGSISPSGTNTINQGTAVTYTFTPNTGYQVASILVDGVSQSIASSYTFPSSTTGSHTISVTFSAIPPVQYTVTASAGANGSISPSGSVSTNQGTSRTFTITPASGFQISSVTVDGSNQGAISTYTFPGSTSGSHTISASFIAIPPTIFTITASAGANGTISPSGAVSVNSGATQNFTVAPNSGFQIASVVIDGTSAAISTTYSFPNVNANHTISVTFSALPPPPTTFTITASAGTGGTVSPATQTVNSGSSASITITPNSGFQISSITLDGVSQTITSPFTISNVTANHAVSVTFSQSVQPPPGSGTTYYVSINSGNDANTGKSDALAFKTLQKAANVVVPGDTVIVRAGTYPAGFELPFKQGATARISFLADPGVTITGPSNGPSGNVGIGIAIGYNFPNAVSASMEPVTIQGFTIDGSNGSISSFGIYVMWADGTIIQNNTAMHTGSTGIFSKYTSNILIQNNTAAFDGKVEGQHGVYVADSNSHATIRGNLLYNNFDSGIHMNGDAASGLYPQAGDHTGDINFALIEDNIIHDNGLNGMNLDGLRNSVIRNNLLYQNGQALGHKDITIFTSDSADSPLGNAIYNNTITSTISNGTTHHNINMDSGTGSNNNNAVFNNVVYQVWAPNGDAPILIDSTVANGTLVGHDAATVEAAGSTDVAIPSDNPANIFANFAGNDFHLKSGSVLIDKGVASLNGFNANAVVNGFPSVDLDGNARLVGSAYDIGAYEFGSTVTPPDSQAPTTPTGLTANAVSTTQINLSWTASTDNTAVSGYKIFRNGTQITTVTGTSYQDTGLTQSTSYSYTVAAYDAAGNTSAQSQAASATTQTPAPDTQAPSMPTGLTASAPGSNQVNLSWTASTDNIGVTGYKVFRNSTQITTVSGTSYIDTSTAANTAYSYTVAAYDAAGNTSSQSSAANVTTPSAPAAGQNLSIDVNVSKDQGSAAASVTSPAFTTTSSNELLLALVSTDSTSVSSPNSVTSVTGGGLTWSLVKRTNTQGGTAEIWKAFAPSTLSGITVTANFAQTVASAMTIMSFAGASTVSPIGASNSCNAGNGAPTCSLVTTANNSWVIGVGNDYDNSIARTVGSNQTLIHQYLAPVGDTYWMQRQTSTTPTAGTSVTINDTAPTTDSWNLSIVEVIP